MGIGEGKTLQFPWKHHMLIAKKCVSWDSFAAWAKVQGVKFENFDEKIDAKPGGAYRCFNKA